MSTHKSSNEDSKRLREKKVTNPSNARRSSSAYNENCATQRSTTDKLTSSKRRRLRRKQALKNNSESINASLVDDLCPDVRTDILESKPTAQLGKVDNLIAQKNMSQASDKPKEQIQAERKMKKAAKQSAKNKEPVEKSSKIISPEAKTPKTKEPIESSPKVNSAEVKIAKNKETEKNPKVISPEVKTAKNKEPLEKNPKVVSPETKTLKAEEVLAENLGSKDAEKSRDEVKAEREAKKLAKQAKKKKTTNEPISAEPTLNKENLQPTPSAKDTVESIDVTDRGIMISSEKETLGGSEKSKAELRAERRAKQEAQRAAKEAAKTIVVAKIEAPKQLKEKEVKTKALSPNVETKKLTVGEKAKPKLTQNFHKVKLFNHLYAEKDRPVIPVNYPDIHRAVIRLGIQYASHTIIGSNARCIALLNVLKEVVRDYSLPPNVEFSRGFEAHLAPCLKFLNSCRSPSVSMNNALKHIKWQLTQLPNTTLETDGKAKLCEAIDVYIKDQIEVAGKAISITVTKKIANDDIILTYGCSSLIEHILVDAAAEKKFRVVIVEARPWNEGKELLRRLTSKGIKCSLVMISALSFVMREVNKVILGAGALLANGYVMARAGTAQVAMVAHAHNVPVLVCCETHKFSERVQTDSFVYNEIGDPDDLIDCNASDSNNALANWRSYSMLSPLNLFYDVTPPDLVTAVVTELAVLPCTSVPVILRMKPSEFL